MAIVLSDSFERDDGPPGTAPSGQTWDVEAGSYAISSEKLLGSSQGLVKIDCGLDGNDGYEVAGTINIVSHSGSTPGLVFGAEDINSRMGVFLDPTNIFLSHAGGSDSNVNYPTTVNENQDYHIRIRWEGAEITVWLDDEEIISQTMGAGDQAIYLDGAHTYVGFRGTQATLDDLTVDDLQNSVVVPVAAQDDAAGSESASAVPSQLGDDSAQGASSVSVQATSTNDDSAQGDSSVSVQADPASDDSAQGASDVSVVADVDAVDTAIGKDVAISGLPRPGADAGTGSATYSIAGDLAAEQDGQGVDEGLVAADLDGGTDLATGADSAHPIILGSDEAGEGAWSYHVDAELNLTQPGVGSEGAVVETLFGDLIVSIFGVDPDSGVLFPLPDFEQLTLSPERNSKGAINLTYPATGVNFDRLRGSITADRDLEVEIWTSGSSSGALRGYLQEAAGDDVAEGDDAVWTFAGSFLEVRMSEAVVYPQDPGPLLPDPNGGEPRHANEKRELVFAAATPGEVIATCLQQAQDRGALTDITRTFTTEVDSNGTPWPTTVTTKYSPGATYTQVLDQLVEFGVAEWAIEWTGTERELKLWAPEGRGFDRTLGQRPVVLRRGRNLQAAPRKWTLRESATAMLAAGAEGVYQDTEDATALARRGRRIEAYTSANNLSDDEAVLAFAQKSLEVSAPGVLEVTHEIAFLPGEARPIVAFNVGDWVYSQVGTDLERLRVVQWTLTVDNDQSLAGTVTLNDQVTNELIKLQRRLNAIAAGEAVVGTSVSPDLQEDTTPPAMPEGLAASSIAYQDPEHGPGQTLAAVTVGWLPVTMNADGSNSPTVVAAVYILARIEDVDPEDPDTAIDDAWLWSDAPQVVFDYAATLIELYEGDPADLTASATWLQGYIDEMTATPTAADDVAGYEVRYAYIGLEQVGGIPSSDPYWGERVYWQATPPGGVSGTSYSFGGVEGGANLRVEVRAFDRAGNFGPWASIGHDTANDVTPPPVPSAPTGLRTWFATADIPWDGLGAEGEPMPSDFSHVRVWLSRGADMTLPTEVAGPVQFDPTEAGPQYVANLYAAGVWNQPDLPYGVGWYAALQAVDHAGNASELSEVVGPVTAKKLVNIDIGPDAIDRQQIIDGEIVRAKIADAAINSAKVEELEVGKLSSGTMEATVTISGQFRTSASSSENRVEFDAAGIRLYRGTMLVGNWDVADGDVLITGTYRSGISGQRIHVDPDGSMSFYATSDANPSTITNEGNDMVWRGPVDNDGFSGRLNVNTLGVGLNYSEEGNLLGSISSEIVVFDSRARITAPLITFEVDGRHDDVNDDLPNDGRRIQFFTRDSSGNIIARSGFSYGIDSSGWGGMYGNDTGWKLAAIGPNGHGRFVVTNGALGNYGVGWSAGWDTPSSGDVKEDVEDARALLDPIETIRNARARKFRYTWSRPDEAPRVGLIAEELPEALHRPVTEADGTTIIGLSLNDQMGVLWGAFNQLLDQEIVSTSAIAVLDPDVFFPRGIFAPGATAEAEVTWESTPPAAPTGGFVQMHSSFIWAGKVTAWIKTGTVTDTGCTVVFKNISNQNVVVGTTDNTRVSATVVGLGLYTPPYVPPEE